MGRVIKHAIATLAITAVAFTALTGRASAQRYEPQGVTSNPQIEARWNYFRDYEESTKLLKDLAAAFPELCELESLGQSWGGREMWVLTVTDESSGAADSKPAFYIDGGIHANELQSVDVVLYTAWYLCEMHGKSEFVTNLLRDRTFYLIPMMSPDSRDSHFYEANNTHGPRTGQRPRDDDRDGLTDEDGDEDLNGDGHITMMRRENPNGRWKEDPEYPGMMIRAEADERGTHDVFWGEGIDNDGDGQVNEDGPGYYDPNRDWAWNWQPQHVQWGAWKYPFSVLENRMAADFVMAHPNIAGAQSYHNTGGMILRGPGAEGDSYPANDSRVYDLIGEKGEQMLPGYDYMITHADLYTVYGGELDWVYRMQGAICYTNELFTSFNYFRKPEGTDDWMGSRDQRKLFNELLLFDEGATEWESYEHPTYGAVEIGGWKKNWGRQPPSFMLEEECHRNMAFTLFHADEMPLVEVTETAVKELPGGLTELTATIVNNRLTPTRMQVDVDDAITRPDEVMLEGDGFTVHTSFYSSQAYFENMTEQQRNPAVIQLPRIGGLDAMYVKFIISGNVPEAVSIDSVKGGSHRLAIK